MSFGMILETLILGPLRLLFEFVFQFSNSVFHNPGISIIALSLIMNVLVLPLYKRADDMQEEARNTENKLSAGVKHIKKTFSGNEKMMILQTYYRQNNYKPTNALNGSVSLLLQIPFFMAAYNFLSSLEDLQSASLGPIRDLGAPDGLIVMGSVTLNLLPILMTLINIVSSIIYLKGFPMKTKIQLYGMALFFLVFLYQSPAGLVFYWTLNNVFSLGKTIFYKIKNPQKVMRILLSFVGIIAVLFGLFGFSGSLKKKLVIVAIGLLMQVVWIYPYICAYLKNAVVSKETQPNKNLFLLGSIFLTLLVGALISSTLINASPQEFVDIAYFKHPLWYVFSSLCLAAGTFLIWLRVFYWLAKPKMKVIFERAVFVLSGIMLVNYMFFGTKLGNISPTLQFSNDLDFKMTEQLINLAVILIVAVVFYIVAKKYIKAVVSVLLVASIAVGAMSAVNAFSINKSVNNVSLADPENVPNFNLSKNGKNVIVIMMDRAMGLYVPYILNEKPELKEQFDGFTYYSNVVSFGPNTNFAVPALLGGYEYTPVELNKRDSESLMSKHNEALLVMPTLFSQNGYDVTVCDPTYANYNYIPDLSLYDKYPEIDKYITMGRFGDIEQKKQTFNANLRNFFCFSVMKCLPLSIQPAIYTNGNYRRTFKAGETNYSNQVTSGLSKARGYGKGFMESYDVLRNLSNMSRITDDDTNTFLFISNEATHDPMLLQTPEYVPSYEVDNTQYDAEHPDRFNINGESIDMSNAEQIKHYHSNMAAFIQIGNWLDYLKEQGVYDNTRIIIVSDHGLALSHSEKLAFSNSSFSETSAEEYFPLLMVKDFDSKGFSTSDMFMTNADVPTLAVNDLIENPTNPFTGNLIDAEEKHKHKQMVIVSNEWSISKNNGKTFLPSKWASVSNNIWDKNNWEFCAEKIVLDEHALP